MQRHFYGVVKYLMQICCSVGGERILTRSSATAEGPRDRRAMSVKILSTAAYLYEKSHLEDLQ